MNLERIHYLIKHPQETTASDINPLKELTVKYPYAQLFPILYLKALHQNKDIRFEEELNRYAYRLTDRAKLFDLIYDYTKEQFVEQEEKTETAVTLEPIVEVKPIVETETPPPAEVLPEIEPAIEEEIVSPEAIEEEEKTIDVVDEALSPEIIPEIIPEETPSPTIEEETEITEAPKQDTNDLAFLEKEFLSNIIASSYSIEHEEKKHQEEKPAVDLSEKRSFSSWLKVSHPEEQAKDDKAAIIDSFIAKKSDASVIKAVDTPKKEFYSAPKRAKESVNEENLIYSETLANIYAMQGNFPKAIQAFQQLMLTNPEKKLYFAQKINELNKKINT
jgi:tetratricopeptide (TPR) repeat protein